MKFAAITERLASLGSEKWAVHFEGRRRAAKGDDLIFLSIGEPDMAPPPAIFDVADKHMRAGRTRYSPGEGEISIRESLARHYTRQMGRDITPRQFIYLSGTQSALSMAFICTIEPGDEVILLDPYYATYEGVVSAPGGVRWPCPSIPTVAFIPISA